LIVGRCVEGIGGAAAGCGDGRLGARESSSLNFVVVSALSEKLWLCYDASGYNTTKVEFQVSSFSIEGGISVDSLTLSTVVSTFLVFDSLRAIAVIEVD
jgi:hypothetical protein